MSRKPVAASPAGAPKPATPRTAYLVLGMHRSGTSAVTQLLALAGAALPVNVMPGNEHNAKGYFEPWKIAIFNDERLLAAGSTWDDPFAYPYRPLPPDEERLWLDRAGKLFAAEFRRSPWPLMKDPRATVLLPFWLAVLAERQVAARCVIPIRHPLAVAGSLGRRDGFPPEKSVLVWAAYMLAAEAYTRELPRAFVDYDALLADWRTEVARIEAAHGAPLPRLTEAAGREIDDFLTPELRHNAAEGGLTALGWTGAIAQDVLDGLAPAATGGQPDRKLLDRAAQALAVRAREIGPLLSSATRDLGMARSRLVAAADKLTAAKAFEAELREEMRQAYQAWEATAEAQRVALHKAWRKERDRMELGWQADQERLSSALTLLAEVDTELTAVLAPSSLDD